jgi:hypothetical protein
MVVERGVAGRAGATRATALSTPPHACPRQRRRRPTPRFRAADACGITTLETCVSAAANPRPKSRTRRRTIARGLSCHCADTAGNIYPVPLYICRVVLLLLRQRRGVAGNGLGTTAKYLRQTTSDAAGNGLGATIKYLRGATGYGLGATIKYLRSTTSAAGNGMG